MYQTEVFLATEHQYRRERLARSWGGPIFPWRRSRRSVEPAPVVRAEPAHARVAAPEAAAPREAVAPAGTTRAGAACPEPAIATYRDRVVVGFR